jgi:hypothetical protein
MDTENGDPLEVERISPSQRKFLKSALCEVDVGFDDYRKYHLTEKEVMELVKKNILTVNHSERFEIQFDSWRKAVPEF